MCIVSNTIKFCSCKANSTDKLQHYWQLFRRNKNNHEMIIGQVLLPYDTINLNYKTNQKTLLKRINEPSAFDIPLELHSNDILEIVFHNKDDYKRKVYGFKFSKGEWKIHKTYPFSLIDHYEVMFGKIKK